MSFGLINAPDTFKRVLDIILDGYRWHTWIVYLDDVIVFSNSFDKHTDHLDDLLSAPEGSDVMIRLVKCNFFAATVNYSGHTVRTDSWR